MNKNKKIKNYATRATPMNTIFPGIPQGAEPATEKWSAPKLDVIEGLKVVTINTNVPQASVSLAFQAGSRVESSKNAGVSALVKHLAYKVNFFPQILLIPISKKQMDVKNFLRQHQITHKSELRER